MQKLFAADLLEVRQKFYAGRILGWHAVKREFLVEKALGIGVDAPFGARGAVFERDLGRRGKAGRRNLVVEIVRGGRIGQLQRLGVTEHLGLAEISLLRIDIGDGMLVQVIQGGIDGGQLGALVTAADSGYGNDDGDDDGKRDGEFFERDVPHLFDDFAETGSDTFHDFSGLPLEQLEGDEHVDELARQGKSDSGDDQEDNRYNHKDREGAFGRWQDRLDFLEEPEKLFIFGEILGGELTGKVVVAGKPELDAVGGHYEDCRKHSFQEQEHHARQGNERGDKARGPFRSQTSVFRIINHQLSTINN